MNGRLYDPLLHRFLAPDNYVQDPFNTQSFNRYGYVWNNPLSHADITGEWFGIDDGIAFLIGGTINLVVNAIQGNINSWGDGFAAFGAGGAAGTLALYGPAGWVAGGMILGGTNAYLSGGNVGMGIFTGGLSGFVGGAVGQWASQYIGNVLINGFNIASPVVKGALSGMLGGSAGGFASGFVVDLALGGNMESAFKSGLQGAGAGALTGSIAGAASAYAYAKINGMDPMSGKYEKSAVIGEGMKDRITPVAKDLNAEKIRFPEDIPAYLDGKLKLPPTPEGLEYNANWIQNEINLNTHIYDIGPRGNSIQSPFYNLEVGRTYNYPLLHRTYYQSYFGGKIRIITF